MIIIINWKLQSAIIYYPTCWIADVPLCTQCFPVETFVITVICPWGQVTNQGDVACQVTSHCWLKHTQSSSRDTTMHFSWFTVFMEMHSKGYKGRKLKRVIIVPCLEGNNIKTFQFCWSACPSHQSSMKCPNNYMDGLLLTLSRSWSHSRRIYWLWWWWLLLPATVASTRILWPKFTTWIGTKTLMALWWCVLMTPGDPWRLNQHQDGGQICLSF